MTTSMKTKPGRTELALSLIALSMMQALLLGCATRSPSSPEQQVQMKEFEKRIQRADAIAGGI